MMIKKWGNHWKIEKSLARGGQGTTAIVRSKRDGIPGVLKLLHLNRNRARQARARMAVEIENLKELHETGAKVPCVLDDNSEMLKDPAVPLYFVMELIDGKNLRQYVSSKGRLPHSESIALLKGLIATVKTAHQLGILHRDIKPENIIVSQVDDNACLVLLDFGVSFSTSRHKTLTKTLETIGNKFLALPESMTPSGDRRDKRSDLTYVIGILYFMITGHDPKYLTPNTWAPHRRADSPFVELCQNNQELRSLIPFFDRGFCDDIDYRFQSTQDIEDYLETELGREEQRAIHDHNLSAGAMSYVRGAMMLNNFNKVVMERPRFGIRGDLLEWLDKYITAYLRFCAEHDHYYNRKASESLDNVELNVDEKKGLYECAETVDSIGGDIPHHLLTSIECQVVADIFGVIVPEQLDCVVQSAENCLTKKGEYLTVFLRHPGANNYYPLWAVIQRTEMLPLPRQPYIYRNVAENGGITCWRCGGF